MKKKRRVWALFLALIMVLSTAIPSYAADVSDSTEISLEEQYEAKAAEVVRGFGFDDSTSDYDKVVTIQTWIDDYVKYDWYWYRYINGLKTDGYEKHTEYPNSKYGAMLDGYSVCGGYSEVFSDLAQKCGLRAVEVIGKMGYVSHAWDIVEVNGESYFIDPTNVHEVVTESQDFLFGTNSAIGGYVVGDSYKEFVKQYDVKEFNYRYYHSECNGNHNFVKDANSKSATCTVDGYDIYYCTNSGCHAYYKVGYAAPGHHWDEGVVTKEPTCTEDGIRKYTCVDCKDQILGGNSYKEESIPKLGHDIDYTQPMNDTRLCFSDKTLGYGSVQFPCTREGCTYLETKYAGLNSKYKIDHDYVVISDTATCTEAGTIKKMCVRERTDGYGTEYNGKMVCGKTVTTTSPAKGHQHTEVRNASSTYTGDTYCTDCGALVAQGHSITHHWDNGTVKKAPTCTEAGEMLYTCTDENCSETKTELIPATGHKNKEIRNKKDATCTEAGYTGDTYCADCDTKLESGEETKALGHDYKKTSETPSTCKDHGTAIIYLYKV